MTLIFDKNGDRDTRLNDYEQAIIAAGLAKAEAERELDRAKQEVLAAQKQRDGVAAEIADKNKDLKVLDARCIGIQREIAMAIRRGSEGSIALQERLEKGAVDIEERKGELDKLNSYLVSLDEQIDTKTKKIAELQEAAVVARKELEGVLHELSQARIEFEELKSDIQSLYKLKVEVTAKMTTVDVERQEIEEIVKMLKESNKEGLDLVASFEGERKRLQEKEEFLKRKEADLLVYENRLKKHCTKVGYDVEMVFK